MHSLERTALDPRIRRTRTLLQSSLRDLLQRKPLEEIAVQDITDAATVNRATFYDHYVDKYDLFNALIAADFEQLLAQRKVCLDESCASGLGAIVLAVGDFLKHVHCRQAGCSPQHAPLIDSAITLAIRRIIMEGLERENRQFIAPREVVASLASAAICSGVKEVLSSTKWKASEAAILSITQLVHPLLERGTVTTHAAAGATPSKRSKGSTRSRKST
jgi:AcrR family transcriptional regulator